jgi:hypothetical protein
MVTILLPVSSWFRIRQGEQYTYEHVVFILHIDVVCLRPNRQFKGKGERRKNRHEILNVFYCIKNVDRFWRVKNRSEKATLRTLLFQEYHKTDQGRLGF